MRANRSTLVRLCLLTALAIPAQRAILATGAQAAQANNPLNSPQLVAQVDAAAPFTTATSPDGALTARVDENDEVLIEAADGTPVAGPLETGETVTALAFSEDGQVLATGTEAGTVRYWGVDGTPKGEAFPVVLGDDNAVTELEFDGNDRLFAAGSEGRSGFWGLNGLSYGEEVVAQAENADADREAAGGSPWWWLALLLVLGGGGLWLLSRRRSPDPSEPTRQTAPTATVPPPPDESNGGEVSNRAQSVISTDRVTDDSRAVSPLADEPLPPGPLPIGLPGVEPEAAGLTADESTDLESPDLEGTNLDLLAPKASGLEVEAVAITDTPSISVESADEDIWDDNLDLTLDEASEDPEILAAEMPPVKEPIAEVPIADGPVAARPATAAEVDDFWGTTDDSGLGDVEAIEPTRDTVIAETETIPDLEPTRETIISEGAVIFGAVVASVRSEALDPLDPDQADLPLSDSTPMKDAVPLSPEALASVDDDLPELPDGYGDSRIVLLPRDPKWAYAYWDVSNIHKEALRQQGGDRLMLRLYDVTDVDQSSQSAHSMQQQECHEMARSWYIEMPVSDRDYTIEIGYLTADDRWLMLARSAAVRVPPVYPSNWVKDQFRTVSWEEELEGRTVADLGRPEEPGEGAIADQSPVYETLFAAAQGQEAMRIAGSLYGSMQSVPPGALSLSGALNMSGLSLSGLNMSGIGSGGGEMPERSRKFWLVADAELIVYGATEPNATLTVGDRVIPLNPDGTFRFHVAFPDGQIDYPIKAVAVDGEQSRAVSLHFERETPERDTNTKEEAEDEWF